MIRRKKARKTKITTLDIELAFFKGFDVRKTYLIVPNVSWGLQFKHELDLLICSKATKNVIEIEIKVSKADIVADKKKLHCHDDNRIKQLYFAVPDYLEDFALQNIPDNAGLYVIKYLAGNCIPVVVKKAKTRPSYRSLTDKEYLKLAELGCLRILSLKEKLKLNQRCSDEKQKKY